MRFANHATPIDHKGNSRNVFILHGNTNMHICKPPQHAFTINIILVAQRRAISRMFRKHVFNFHNRRFQAVLLNIIQATFAGNGAALPKRDSVPVWVVNQHSKLKFVRVWDLHPTNASHNIGVCVCLLSCCVGFWNCHCACICKLEGVVFVLVQKIALLLILVVLLLLLMSLLVLSVLLL